MQVIRIWSFSWSSALIIGHTRDCQADTGENEGVTCTPLQNISTTVPVNKETIHSFSGQAPETLLDVIFKHTFINKAGYSAGSSTSRLIIPITRRTHAALYLVITEAAM